MTWQPIETAPKDGTPFLASIYFPGDKKRQTMVVRKKAQWGGWYSVPGDYCYRPTHWMPLPEPLETQP